MKNQIIRTSIYVFIVLVLITCGLQAAKATPSNQCGSSDPDVMPECVHGRGLYVPIAVVVPALKHRVNPMLQQTQWDDNVAFFDKPIPIIKGTKVWTGARICVRSRFPESKMSVSVQIRDGFTDEVYQMVVIDTWKGDSCSEAFTFTRPIHIQHKIYLRIKSTNFDNFKQWASANAGMYAE